MVTPRAYLLAAGIVVPVLLLLTEAVVLAVAKLSTHPAGFAKLSVQPALVVALALLVAKLSVQPAESFVVQPAGFALLYPS